jgi:hypothetical protein
MTIHEGPPMFFSTRLVDLLMPLLDRELADVSDETLIALLTYAQMALDDRLIGDPVHGPGIYAHAWALIHAALIEQGRRTPERFASDPLEALRVTLAFIQRQGRQQS